MARLKVSIFSCKSWGRLKLDSHFVFFDMTIAEENADLKAQLDAATAGTSEAQAKFEALGEQTDNLEKANAALIDKVAVLEGELADAKADQVDVEEKAGAQAAEIVAQQGAEPVAEDVEEVSKAKTLSELWADYAAIDDLKEKTVFYRSEIKPQL